MSTSDITEIINIVSAVLAEFKIKAKLPDNQYTRKAINDYLNRNKEKTKNRIIMELTMKFYNLLTQPYEKMYGLGPITESNIKNVDVRIFGKEDPRELTRAVNIKNLYKTAYIGLNGLYATISGNKISWSISDVIISGGVQVRNKFRDVTEIKMYTSLVNLTVPASRPSSGGDNTILQPLTTITNVLIDECAGDSFIGQTRRFHFISYDSSTLDTSTQRKLIVDNSCQGGLYVFNSPITVLDKITLSFARHDQLMPILEDNSNPTFINMEIKYLDDMIE